MIRGHKLFLEYEGFHLICFNCGCYGHRASQCVKPKEASQGVKSTEAGKDSDKGKDQEGNKVNKEITSSTSDVSQVHNSKRQRKNQKNQKSKSGKGVDSPSQTQGQVEHKDPKADGSRFSPPG